MLSPQEQNDLSAFLFTSGTAGMLRMTRRLARVIKTIALVDARGVRYSLDAKQAQVELYQVYLNIDLLEAVPKSGRLRQQIMKSSTACRTGRGLRATTRSRTAG